MASMWAVKEVERILNYEFSGANVLTSALVAADRIDESNSKDGNRKLALLGDSVLRLVLEERWLATGSERAELQKSLPDAMKKSNLALIAKRSGVDLCITPSPRQTEHPAPPGVCSTAIKALIAAVWLDSSKSWDITRGIVTKLIGWGGTIPPGFTTSFQPPEDSEVIDPNALSLDQGRCSEDELMCSHEVPRPPLTGHSPRASQQTNQSVHKEKQEKRALPLYAASYSRGKDSSTPNTLREPEEIDQEAVSKEPRSKASNSSKAVIRKVEAINGYVGKVIEEQVKAEVQPMHDCQSLDVLISRFQLNGHTIFARKMYYRLGSCESVVSAKNILRSYRDDQMRWLYDRSAIGNNAQRLEVIDRLDSRVAFLGLLRRCHILELYEQNSRSTRKTTEGFVMSTSSSSSGSKRKFGNPNNCAESDVTREMLQEMYPGMDQDDNEYRAQYRRVSTLRRLGRRLSLLKETFGLGVFLLLASPADALDPIKYLKLDDNELLSVSEDAFQRCARLLVYAGDDLSKLGSVGTAIVTGIFHGSMLQSERFKLEQVSSAEILALPRGSSQLLDLFAPSRPSVH